MVRCATTTACGLLTVTSCGTSSRQNFLLGISIFLHTKRKVWTPHGTAWHIYGDKLAKSYALDILPLPSSLPLSPLSFLFCTFQLFFDMQSTYDIQYTASDQSYAERTKHFIFLVGATSSMGYNWQYFLRAAQKFAGMWGEG